MINLKKDKTTPSDRSVLSWMPDIFSLIGSIFVPIILAYITYSTFIHRAEITALNAKLETLKKQNESGYRFDSKEEFEAAVAAAVNSLVDKKRLADIKEKYAAYENAAETVEDGKHIYGDLNARFTLVEFSDIECPYCKQFHNTPREIADASKGNVNWQWKNLPLDFHNPAALQLAMAAECVAELKGNRAFWVAVGDMFEQTGGNGRGVKDLAALVDGTGTDVSDFRDCMVSERHNAKIQEDIQLATRVGITGTPALVIVDNQTGKSQVLKGAQPPQSIMAIIKRMMEEPQS